MLLPATYRLSISWPSRKPLTRRDKNGPQTSDGDDHGSQDSDDKDKNGPQAPAGNKGGPSSQAGNNNGSSDSKRNQKGASQAAQSTGDIGTPTNQAPSTDTATSQIPAPSQAPSTFPDLDPTSSDPAFTSSSVAPTPLTIDTISLASVPTLGRPHRTSPSSLSPEVSLSSMPASVSTVWILTSAQYTDSGPSSFVASGPSFPAETAPTSYFSYSRSAAPTEPSWGSHASNATVEPDSNNVSPGQKAAIAVGIVGMFQSFLRQRSLGQYLILTVVQLVSFLFCC